MLAKDELPLHGVCRREVRPGEKCGGPVMRPELKWALCCGRCGWQETIMAILRAISAPAVLLHEMEQARLPEAERTVRMHDTPCMLCVMPALHVPAPDGGVDMHCMVCPGVIHEYPDGSIRRSA